MVGERKETAAKLRLAEGNSDELSSLELLDREDLLGMVKKFVSGGVVLSFHGKRTASEIDKKVRPRSTRIIKNLCVGSPEQQAANMIIEGENLQAMVTLYKYRGQVDLIVTDPPYNTGQFFRYNDRWDSDPNDPELGTLVTLEDGSRHTKWMKAMMPRLNMMKAMLKPGGVIAICIDHNELFHLGMMMDEVFKEENRLAIINWQKTTSKNDAGHVSVTTEYVLVYAKDSTLARTGSLERSGKSNIRFQNQDNDVLGVWKQGDLTAPERSKNNDYAIQSPFTGQFYDPGNRHWANRRSKMREWLEQWGVKYEECEIGDKRGRALALKGWSQAKSKLEKAAIVERASRLVNKRLSQGNWPLLYWGVDGLQKPVKKMHKLAVRSGAVPLTFWVDEDEAPINLDSVSWLTTESGRSRDGVEELGALLGKNHGFTTVKPLKLIKKIIHLWCPAEGLVLDPYAGSGTTGHAILELNEQAETNRRFILIEQGSPERGDKYARSLTRERLKRAITGERPDCKGSLNKSAKPVRGGFEFRMLTKQIDAKVVLTMLKDELIDVIITSHWEANRRKAALIRIEEKGYKFLVGKDEANEGYFIIWNGGDAVQSFDDKAYSAVLQEAKREGIKPPYHVYARYEDYQSKSVDFNKIPDKILAHLGLNENSDRFNDEEAED